MSRSLLIVDPQIDFISGSLPVPQAEEAMDWLASYLQQHYSDYDNVVVTLDQHPMNHCSFKENGGLWPVHCVKYSIGSAVYPPLMEVLKEVEKHLPVSFLEKAVRPEKDEYSAFEVMVPSSLSQADEIHVAGLAGDVCVKQSVEDLRKQRLGSGLTILEKGVAYIRKD